MEEKKLTPDKWQFSYNVTKEEQEMLQRVQVFLWE